jgi:c-di-GMP-binding flagellar brake protein YcgR
MTIEPLARRRHRRVKFVYPVEFKILSSGFENRTFRGLFSTISVAGAGFHFKDKYGVLDLTKLEDTRLKLEINVLQEEQLIIIARVRYVRTDELKQDFSVLIGVEFEDLFDWQLEKLEKIISLRNKDRKMMWNLWEHYVEDGSAK